MAQEIDINLNVNAQQADKSLGSLKSQLREAQAEVQTLSDKFGATSTEAINAARAAAVLKDKIGDAKNLTDAFNPDAKFKALSASIGGVASGFAAYQGALGLAGVQSKELEQQLLKVQSAMAVSQGLQGLGEARDSFKQLGATITNAAVKLGILTVQKQQDTIATAGNIVATEGQVVANELAATSFKTTGVAAKTSLNGIKGAIAATGIGLLVIALGTIVAYWDDIKGAVNGVSSEQKKLNQLAEKNVQSANENLKAAKSMDNTLKLQGKSEQQILDIKIKATQQAIDANISRVKGLQLTNKLEAEAAQRNYERLKSFIDFVSIPQRILFESAAAGINKIIDLANKIPGIDIKGKIDEKFASKATDYITKLVFDPAKTKAEGAANLAETQNAIKDLENEKAGYINSKNKQDTKNNKDEVKSTEDKNKEAFDAEKKLVEEKLKNDKLSIVEKRNIVLEDNKLSKEDRLKFLEELRDEEIKQEEAHNKAIADLNKRYDEEKANRLADTNVKKEQLDYERRLTEINNIAQTELEKQTLIEKLNGEHAVRLADATKSDNEKKIAAAKVLADKEIADAKAVADAKVAIQQGALDALGGLVGLAKSIGEKNKGLQKAALVAETALGIANVIIGTNVGAAKEVATKGIFGLTTATILYAKMGISIAAILAASAKGFSALGGGGGGASGGGGGAGGGAAAAPSFNIVGPSGANQIAESIGNKESQPLKAFVVGGDVTSQQSLNRGIVQNATLG